MRRILTFLIVSSVASVSFAQEREVIPPPAPTPSVRSGTFSCDMHDRGGRAFRLSGEVGNWREEVFGKNRLARADFVLEAPEDTGLSGIYTGNTSPGDLSFSAVGASTQTFVRMNGSFGPEGTIMIERRAFNGGQGRSSLSYDFFVGICGLKLSAQTGNLIQ